MKQTLIKNVEVWTMDEQDRRFSGWVLLEDGKIAAMGEGEPPACAEMLDGEGGVLTTPISGCMRMVLALRARTATRTPTRSRRTCA